MKPTTVELFAGAGGAALGLSSSGFEHLACLEWDEHACATLRAAGLPVVEGDVRDPALYDPAWRGCDLLWSSFPCQAWSSAGARRGAEDDRNGWPWTVEAIDRLRPRWFAFENVTGLRQHKGGCENGCLGPERCPLAYFDLVILRQLRERFSWVGFRVLNASDFGVPQHRRRIVLVAGPRPIEWPEPTHGKPTAQRDLFGRSLAPWKTIRDALGVEGQVIGGGANPRAPGESEKRNYRDISEEPSTTIAAVQIGNAGPWVVDGREPWRLDEPSLTVTTTEAKGTRGESMNRDLGNGKRSGGPDRACDAFWLATGRRRLSVLECALLQDFPPDHPFQGPKGSQYRQVGNAVPPTLARVVGLSIKRAMKENER